METNNRIREEWENKLRNKWETFSVVNDYYENADIRLNSDRIADFFILEISELLKSQRDSLVDRLPECAWCDLENGRGKYLLESDIINLIKNN